MNIFEVVKIVDGGIAVTVMLVIGYRIEKSHQDRWDDIMKLLDKLTKGD